MSYMKSLCLGSAAVVAVLSGAQAADLPIKAKAIEYVRICSLYGAGFYYIPGTDTCIKLGGYLRAETFVNGGISESPYWSGSGGAQDRFRDYFTARSRMALTIDTRTATEYGVVRTFGQGDWTFDTFNGGSTNASVVAAAAGGAGVNQVTNTPANGYTAVEYLFIQFAGFTIGKSGSAYSTPWHGFLGNNTAFLLGGEDSVTGVNNIQYTAQFGNGVSASVGLDEARVYDRTNLANLTGTAAGSQFTGALGNTYAGNRAPDVVGNVRVDQAWGFAQLSAAAHNVSATYYTPGLETSGHPDDKWGFAVMGALQIKNIPTGNGDDIKLDASYAEGATKYVISSASGSPSLAMFGSPAFGGSYQSVGLGATTDGVYAGASNANGTNILLTKAWGVRGAYNHNWNPSWSTSIFGSASWVKYDGNSNDVAAGIISAQGLICNKMAGGGALVGAPLLAAVNPANYSCNPNFAVTQLGTVTRWTPVQNLTFSGEVMWTRLDQSMSGQFTPAAIPATLSKPVTTYDFRDQNTVSVNLRAQRNF
jgi:hypothetical protein